MRYSIEPRDKIYVKGYRFLSFAKNRGTHATKVEAINIAKNFLAVQKNQQSMQ